MSRILREAGHSSEIIYFKVACHHQVSLEEYDPKANLFMMESLYNGQLCLRRIDTRTLWTETETNILIDRLQQNRPDIIGFSCRSFVDNKVLPLLNRVKNEFPDAELIAGGFGPVLNPAHYLQEADHVAFGDGEETILAVANAFDAGASCDDIDNLIYIRNGELIHNPVRKPLNDLDHYPYPDLNDKSCFIDNDTCYDDFPYTGDERSTYLIQAGRGCPDNCSYCSAHQWRKLYLEKGHVIRSYRRRSTENIIKELQEAKARGYRVIAFIDSYLTGPESFLIDLFTRYKEEIGLPFHAFLSTKQILSSPKVLDIALEAGLTKAILGIQHGSEDFRRKYFNRTDISNEAILQIARMLQDRKVIVEYHVITGIPFEQEADLEESFNFFKKLPMDLCDINVNRLVILPQSPLEKIIREQNLPDHDATGNWYFTGILYQIRTMVDDQLFNTIRSATAGILKDHSRPFQELSGEFYNVIINEFIKSKATIFGNPELLEIFYKKYLETLRGKSILVWGTGGLYVNLKKYFSKVHIKAFIDNDPAKHGRTLDDAAIEAPAYLQECDLPIFICSIFKKDIYQQIKRDYPHISMIP